MKRDEFYSPLPGAMKAVLAAGCLLCALFGWLYSVYGSGWMFSCAISCGTIAYHMLARFAAPGLLWIVFRRKYDCQSRWFQPRPWEEGLYRRLKVQKWKGKALTYAPDEFSLRRHTLDEIIENMCHAEAVHEVIVVLSLLSVLLAIPFGSFWVFALTGIGAAIFDSTFIIIQRYNRPRLVMIARRMSERNRP